MMVMGGGNGLMVILKVNTNGDEDVMMNESNNKVYKFDFSFV